MYALDAFIVKLQYKFDKCTYQFVNVHARQNVNPRAICVSRREPKLTTGKGTKKLLYKERYRAQ